MSIETLNENELLIKMESEWGHRNFFGFFCMAVQVLYPSVKWDFNWHFKYIADILQSEVERIVAGQPKDKDFIINLPFRSGKSILISIIFPIWCWIVAPELNIITVSATDKLATKFSHQSKILIESQWFQERFGHMFQVRTDQHAKGAFMNNAGGRRESFGINSGIIGSGCDIMLLDDIQSPDNVTATGLKNTIESFTDVLYSRLNNPEVSIRICLQQRVHENDISGYLMRTNPQKYLNIVVPAILSKDLSPAHLVTNYEDKLFWKQRFSMKVMDDFKSTMRPAPYAGQLLQRPVPEEGDMIKRAWFDNTITKSQLLALGNLQWNLVIDTATSEKTRNDPSAFMICAQYQNKLIIRHVRTDWLQFHELLKEIEEIRTDYSIHKIYVEDKSSGIQILQELRRATNYNIIPLSPKGKSKEERIQAIQPQLQTQRVILVRDKESNWVDNFLNECASFPFGVHDDMVDCLGYAVEQFLQNSGRTVFR